MSNQSVPTLIISGSVGTGKTTVAYAISSILEEQGIKHGVIDSDYTPQLAAGNKSEWGSRGISP